MARNKKLELNSVSSGVWFTTDGRFAVLRRRKPINPMLVTNDFKVANEFSIRSFEGYDGPKEYPQLAPEIGKVDVFKEVFPWLGEFTGEGSFVVGDPVHSKPLPLGGRRVQEDFDVRGELLEAAWKVNKRWISAARKWWKQILNKSKRFQGMSGGKACKDAIKYLENVLVQIDKFKTDLWLDKAMFPFDMTGNEWKDRRHEASLYDANKIAWDLDHAREKADDILSKVEHVYEGVYVFGSMAYISRPNLRDPIWDEMNAADNYLKNLYNEMLEVDKFISGKVLKRLSSLVKKYSDGHLEPVEAPFDPVPNEFKIGRVKVFIDHGAGWHGKLPTPAHMVGGEDAVVSPEDTGRYVNEIDAARKLITKAGFGRAWYGMIMIWPANRGRSFVGQSSGKEYRSAGSWAWSDQVNVYGGWLDVKRTIAHEVGHRWYYKFMNQQQRAQFDSYFGEVPAVRSYGKENPAEDFATVFEYYVLGKKLTRDQRERFKQFALLGGKIRRQEGMDIGSLRRMRLTLVG